MSVRDRWHLARPEPGAKRCGSHRKVPSSEHEQGLQWQVEGLDDRRKVIRRNFAIKADADAFDAVAVGSIGSRQATSAKQTTSDPVSDVRRIGER